MQASHCHLGSKSEAYVFTVYWTSKSHDGFTTGQSISVSY